jgi:hypothetical protein
LQFLRVRFYPALFVCQLTKEKKKVRRLWVALEELLVLSLESSVRSESVHLSLPKRSKQGVNAIQLRGKLPVRVIGHLCGKAVPQSQEETPRLNVSDLFL